MGCPLLEKSRLERCHAVQTEVIPTLHEREQYCHSEGYARCPTLRLMLQLHRALQEQEYLELWIPPAP